MELPHVGKEKFVNLDDWRKRDACAEILTSMRPILDALAHLLADKGVISGNEVKQTINQTENQQLKVLGIEYEKPKV